MNAHQLKTVTDTLDNRLAQVEAEKQRNWLRNVEAKVFSDTLYDRVAEVKVGNLGGLLTDR